MSYSMDKNSTIIFNNVFIESTGTFVGPNEAKGPLASYFDQSSNDLYFEEKTFEKAEKSMVQTAIDHCLRKVNCTYSDLDLAVGGDLSNQITASNFVAEKLDTAFIGVYGACSTSCLSLLVAAQYVESKLFKKVLAFTSSHNATAERQYRYPLEYGIQKKDLTTFTATGSGSALLSNQKSSVRLANATIGKVIDYKQDDSNDMGRAMTPAAYYTLKQHLKDLNRVVTDYDLILTGDLSTFGKALMKEMFKKDDIELNNYDDCGTLLYDLENQEVFQGGSGSACSALVTYGYIYQALKEKRLNRVLLIATGALLSPMSTQQKEMIPCIAHAICLEAV
jgi:stage V sporulation protein AD